MRTYYKPVNNLYRFVFFSIFNKKNIMETTEKEPIILVFYIYRDVLAQKTIREQYFESVKKYFDEMKMKTAIFFLPTDTEERIECINPRFIDDQNEISKLKKVLDSAERLFAIDTEKFATKKDDDEDEE